MSWTLWRYATIELWRLVLLSAAVLVVVIAFAVAVKPLADGTLGPAEALRFMALASVPMLAYALPFAAAFGATLAYHRMAQDNEVIAALAGGLSHRALLVPALASGLALGGILTALNEQIIPRFLQSMEQMVTRDAIETLVNKIDRGESATVGGMTVHAEGVRRLEIKPGEPLVGKILLERVAAVETDDFGAVTNDATAEYALVMLMPGEAVGADDALAGRIAFNNGTLYRDGTLGVVGSFRTPLFRVPNAFEDDPKFLTFGELLELREHPERMSFVRSRHARLARGLASIEAAAQIRRDLEDLGRVTLQSAGVTLVIRAAALEGSGPFTFAAPPGERIRVEAFYGDSETGPLGGGLDDLRAASALLTLEPESSEKDVTIGTRGSAKLTFRLELADVTIRGRRDVDPAGLGSVETARAARTYEGLALDPDPLARLAGLPPRDLLAEAETTPHPGIADAAGRLDRRIERLGREITSKQHERAAMSLSCLIMVLTGAITAMRMRHALPLVVYLWSFLPALGAIILIAVGQQTTHESGAAAGLPLLYGGVGALGVYAALALRTLSRNA